MIQHGFADTITKKRKRYHCESDKDMETGEMFCLTHQVKICAVCLCEVEEDQIRCDDCLGIN